ncbi:prepilin peptidase, partial [Novosphingobium sp. B-7]
MPMFTVVAGMPAWLLVTIDAILGAIIGSFLGTVAVRLPAGRGIIRAPSACDSCRQRLRPWHLVPIVSWLALRGRCQSCAAPIGRGQLVA